MSATGPRPLVFAVRGPIARSDLPGLCGRICSLLSEPAADHVVCDVCGVEPDAVTVDALARLQLAATRRGCRIFLRNASDELVQLVGLMGLSDVLPER
jgi:ABC-type transporter Mla MlaB component